MRFSPNDTQQVSIAHAHIAGNSNWGLPGAIAPPHLNNFSFAHAPLLDAGLCSASSAPLSVHVGNVVLLGSEKQVVRVDAKRRVAAVKHPKAIWNLSTMNDVGESMGEDFDFGRNVDHSVPAIFGTGLPSRPKPASVGMQNVASKTLSERQVKAIHVIHCALIGAVFIAAAVLMSAHIATAKLASRWYANQSQGVNLQLGFVKARLDDC